ncbi:hypothetical protein EXU57_05880 [Segetibacter sp. 3557_3]|uniref:FG-GAP-like repeat-containing protein n=1 Tax=Segetibacter sp. 3557_3 TaxID=2547429 RepID=UPI001058DAA0|nr:FG-GAP-like repeat-containing protein [Segetibacter sp. 3557_3]TDH27990.1 hypothetical protein EXU57_05880 [Segetibacter sp. 3557_3]
MSTPVTKKFLLSLSGILAFSLTCLAQLPLINSFSPNKAVAGARVVIDGSNFNTNPTGNTVFFGAVEGKVVSAAANKLEVIVPAGATLKPISVLNKTSGLIAFSKRPFIPTFSNGNSYGPTLPSNFYKPQVDFRTQNLPFSVATADIDNDGSSDIIVVNQFSNTVSIFINSGRPGAISPSSFRQRIDLPTGNNPWCVAVEDVDNDGAKDIIVANNGQPSTVSVIRNTRTQGNVEFAAKIDFPCGYAPTSISVDDIDNDGKSDIVTANRTGTVSILRNQSAPGSLSSKSFTSKVDFTLGTVLRFIAIDDIDGDGKNDLVISNEQLNTVSVFKNNTTPGSITPSAFNAKVDFVTGNNPVGVALADLDGDDKPEIITANSGGNTISILHNNATSGNISAASFGAKIDISAAEKPYSVAIADVDGDGKPDIVATNASGASKSISVYRNLYNSGAFTGASIGNRADFNVAKYPYSLAIGDINGDGIPEQVVTGYNSNVVSVLQSVL